MVNIGRTFFSSNYFNYSIELVSYSNRLTLNLTHTKVSVDNLVYLESQMSKHGFQISVDFVTVYNGQYWEPILGMCLYSYLHKNHFIDTGLKKFWYQHVR
jgi:hypothetical protein